MEKPPPSSAASCVALNAAGQAAGVDALAANGQAGAPSSAGPRSAADVAVAATPCRLSAVTVTSPLAASMSTEAKLGGAHEVAGRSDGEGRETPAAHPNAEVLGPVNTARPTLEKPTCGVGSCVSVRKKRGGGA